MAAKALYFPYIRTPENAWFNRALLYWDSVGTIMPHGIEARLVTPRMRELSEAGLLEYVHPDQSPHHMRDHAVAFGELIEGNPEILARRGRLDEFHCVAVHVDKMGIVAETLVGDGLARPRRGTPWMEVEPLTAEMYLAFLATTLGALDSVGMEPLTNRARSLAALAGVDLSASAAMRQADDLQIPVLEALLPAPGADVPVAELRRFKDDYADQLAHFRREVRTAVLELGQKTGDDVRAELARHRTEELVEQRDELVQAMGKRRWPGIVFGAVAGIVAPAVAVAQPVAAGAAVATAIAVPGFVAAVYKALERVGKHDDFMGRPLAYAALAERRFADRD